MLDGIFQVLTSIGVFFANVGGFLSDFISDLVGFVKQLGSMADQISTMLGGFPAYFITGVVALIAIMVLLRVLGRD